MKHLHRFVRRAAAFVLAIVFARRELAKMRRAEVI